MSGTSDRLSRACPPATPKRLKVFLLLFLQKKKFLLTLFLLICSPAWSQTGLFGNPFRFTEPTGESVYQGVCTGCHMPQGQGATGAASYPPLAQNARLAVAAYPILRVLRGQGAMPGFAGTLTNQQIADVVGYIRQHFGNAYPDAPTADDVQVIR